MKGYIFDHEQKKYLVITDLIIDDSNFNPEIENLNISEEF